MKSFGDLMKTASKMQKQMGELQTKFADERFEASAGGDLVKVVVDGHQALKEIKLSPEVLKEKAQKTSKAAYAESLSKITGGMNLPMFGA